MSDFMDYCLKRFYRVSGWKEENHYGHLLSWSQSILDFHTSRGLFIVTSKIPVPHLQPLHPNASKTLHGSIGYIHTTMPLDIDTNATLDFQETADRFSIITKPIIQKQKKVVPEHLIYGRMFFPGAKLEMGYIRQFSTYLQYSIIAVNQSRTFVSPFITMRIKYDVDQYSSELSYTNQGVFSLKGLYNIGKSGHWSTGTEYNYNLLNEKSSVLNVIRYRSLSNSVPIHLTFTFNPISGHVSSSYITQVSNTIVLGSRFDLDTQSKKTDLTIGFEYKTNRIENNIITPNKSSNENLDYLIKTSWGLLKGFGLIWEGRFKTILFKFGLTGNLIYTNPIHTFNFEVQYSS